MSDSQGNLQVCGSCTRREGAICRESGGSIYHHASRGCPLQRFQSAESGTSQPAPRLAGDILAVIAARIGAARVASWLGRIGIDCGCPHRLQRLNRVDAKLRKWFARKT